ncbi:MAG: copper resistance CopC family protein [Actinomycetota bacterium]
MKKSVTSFLIIAITIAGAGVASAHTVLIGSNPSKSSVIKTLPAKITLKFADPLLTLGKHAINKVVVTDPKGVVVTTDKDLVKGAVLTDPISVVSPIIGIYKVSYRVSAQDGHIVTGSYTFTLSK